MQSCRRFFWGWGPAGSHDYIGMLFGASMSNTALFTSDTGVSILHGHFWVELNIALYASWFKWNLKKKSRMLGIFSICTLAMASVYDWKSYSGPLPMQVEVIGNYPKSDDHTIINYTFFTWLSSTYCFLLKTLSCFYTGVIAVVSVMLCFLCTVLLVLRLYLLYNYFLWDKKYTLLCHQHLLTIFSEAML